MAYGVNRKGAQPRAHFQLAGGSIIKFRHPYLLGQINTTSTTVLDEIDVSSCLKLEGRYFEATQAQDSAKQVVTIDGSTITICNRLLNGTLTLPVLRTTGFVGSGDFIAACQLIKSVGDSVGGVLYKTDFINGKALTTLYYGVTVKSCPDDVSEGNDVAVYNVQLFYAGWIQAQGTSTVENLKTIQAVGNAKGLSGYFAPYQIQNADGTTGTGSEALKPSLPGSDLTDDTANGQIPNEDETANVVKQMGKGKGPYNNGMLTTKPTIV